MLNSTMGKYITNPFRVFFFLRDLLTHNWNKKRKIFLWFKKRDRLSNWFYLYLINSSLLLDFIHRISEGLLGVDLLRSLKINVKYTDRLVLSYPCNTVGQALNPLQKEIYMDDFKKCFQHEFTFHEGDNVIDLGAHLGTFSFPLLLEHPSINLFAVEADPNNYQCLEESSILSFSSKANQPNLKHCAIYDHDGELEFVMGKSPTTGHLASSGFFIPNPRGTRYLVKSLTLPSLYKELNIEKCKLLKIDIEGSEYGILDNLNSSFLSNTEYLFIELHPVKNIDPTSYKQKIEELGFEVKGNHLPNGCWELFCHNKNYQWQASPL